MILMVDTAACTLTADGVTTPCIIGRTGACAAAAKGEGDGHTPQGVFALRPALLRPDRGIAAPVTALPWRWLDPADGWSDDPADPAYNTRVRHPHPFSAEHLWRDDGLYDVIVPLGYNDAPPVPGRGSAIFLHCTAGHPVTAGCVAIAREALLALLPWLTPDDGIAIQ
jgi:L,D-peptidoglycan transpeptidase YkuD (ErfK/YbiS/YcfS/YnhG family)